MRPVGKADKSPTWKGSSVKRWQEFTVSLQSWHVANKDFMTEAQAIHKVYQMFKEAGETAAADSLTTYLLLANNIPSFSHILYDIDNLFEVNGVSSALDIENELNPKDCNSKEHPRERRDRPDSRSRYSRRKYKSPHPPRTKSSGSDKSNSRGRRNSNNKSGFTTVSFHITGPSNSTFLINTGAQRSCMGQQTFVNLGGNLQSLSKSENSYIFGDCKPSPSLGRAKIEFLDHVFNIDIVSRDVPGFIGMDILDSKYSIFFI